MKFTVTITVQFSDGPEAPVFRSDSVIPGMLASTLAIAEQSVRATVTLSRPGPVRLREHLGPALLKEELLAA